MARRINKRHKANLELKPKDAIEAPAAVAALKKFKGPKFDQTINVCMFLGVDPKQADQLVRGSVVLPNGIGKTLRVVVFAKNEKDNLTKAQQAAAVALSKQLLATYGAET